MKRSKVFRDQGWLRDNINKNTVDKKIIESQLDYQNRWIKPGRATKDMDDSYEALRGDPGFFSIDRKTTIHRMSAWLRENRRLVPSLSSFRRFLSKKSNG
jgi:hypothetical protein